MTGDAGHLEAALAEVVVHDLARPGVEAEELLDVLRRRAHDDGGRAIGEGGVAGDVVAVRVGVRDDQVVVGAGMTDQPVGHELVDRVPERAVVDSPGVEQERAVATEQQEGERRLEGRVLALPQDHGVGAVVMDLPRWVRGVPPRRRPVDPADVEAPLRGVGAHGRSPWHDRAAVATRITLL